MSLSPQKSNISTASTLAPSKTQQQASAKGTSPKSTSFRAKLKAAWARGNQPVYGYIAHQGVFLPDPVLAHRTNAYKKKYQY